MIEALLRFGYARGCSLEAQLSVSYERAYEFFYVVLMHDKFAVRLRGYA